MKNYIGFLTLLLFITGVNFSMARDHDSEPDIKEAMPEVVEETPKPLPVIKSEEERYTLILSEVNRCQASIMHIAKFINVADAVIAGVGNPEDKIIKQLTTIRERIKEQFTTLNLYEEEAIKKLQELEADVETINSSALQHFEYVMGMGTNFFNGAHTTTGREGLNIFLLTILDITSKCKPNIDRYLDIEIQE
jgi:coenzyme F420-reducing hydrogenase gamma subunit